MGEIADMLLDGTLDFYTGEYLGKGGGIPRTKNKSLEWERRKQSKPPIDYLSSKEVALNGVKKYIKKKWRGSASIPSIRAVVSEYLGESNIDLKQKCLDIQRDWLKFCQWVNKKINDKNSLTS